MFKQKFFGRTENDEFTFTANPLQMRAVAMVILAERGAKFIEIRYMDGRTAMMATFDKAQQESAQFRFTFPEELDED